ncbi:MAG TPA: response regulator transcription factor [Casimicrobiaceae bacterium]|nr:response regulator transcription factor [Casimicrobiaceae bacterium]
MREHAPAQPIAPSVGPPVAVLVVARQHPFPEAARALLASVDDIRIMDHVEPVRRLHAAHPGPDVVLIDVDARSNAAEDVVADLASTWRPTPVIALTRCEDRACNRRLVRAGAHGVVTHARMADHLVAAIHRVRDGEIWLARTCMAQLLDDMVAAGHPAPAHLATPEGLEKLTEREREVVSLIAQGMHNKAIAAELGITDHTVRHHLTAIFAKLGVADRLELAVYAFRHRAG